jgi:hypothetical protein
MRSKRRYAMMRRCTWMWLRISMAAVSASRIAGFIVLDEVGVNEKSPQR